MKGYLEETIEWTSTWREFCEDADTPRVLLIGDSISVGYREIVEKKLGGKYHVTSIATSKALDNPWLISEIRLLAAQDPMKYEVVHVNNGAHGEHINQADYEYYYQTLLRELKRLYPEARFLLALTTDARDETDLSRPSYRNAQVLERNEAAHRLAKEFQMEEVDLYEAGRSQPNLHFRDGLHFTPEGYEVLAQAVADAILK